MAVAIELHTEFTTQVTAHLVGDTVSVTFGDDIHGARLIGELREVHLLLVDAMERLLEIEGL